MMTNDMMPISCNLSTRDSTRTTAQSVSYISKLPHQLLTQCIVEMLHNGPYETLTRFSQTSTESKKQAIDACVHITTASASWKKDKAIAILTRQNFLTPPPYPNEVAGAAQKFIDYAAGLTESPKIAVPVDFGRIAYKALWLHGLERIMPILFPPEKLILSHEDFLSKICRVGDMGTERAAIYIGETIRFLEKADAEEIGRIDRGILSVYQYGQ